MTSSWCKELNCKKQPYKLKENQKKVVQLNGSSVCWGLGLEVEGWNPCEDKNVGEGEVPENCQGTP